MENNFFNAVLFTKNRNKKSKCLLVILIVSHLNFFATDARNFKVLLEFFRVSVASFSALIAATFR